jgi:hypothetical protein
LRRIRSLLTGIEEFAGFTQTTAAALESEIVAAIITELESPAPKLEASSAFASWAAGEFYTRPIEIFTVNYDLLLEMGLEQAGASYFDGFVGVLNAQFRPDLIEPRTGENDETLPSSFVRLWKLHGSLNWLIAKDGAVVRTGAPVRQSNMAAIYPSDEKYDESRRVPFVVLHDRFRRALAEPETLTFISGYSFGDAHLNEVILDSARRYPRSEIVVFCYAAIPAELNTSILQNLTILAPTEAIISGDRLPWCDPTGPTSAEIWSDSKFRLGDFSALARFLAKSRRAEGLRGYVSEQSESDAETGKTGG